MKLNVIYIDVFFAYNFLIDAFLIYVTGKILKIRPTFKIVAGALAGGIYSSLALIKGFGFLSAFPLRLAVLYFMMFLSFNGKRLTNFKACGVFLLSSFVFCGIMLAFGGDFVIVDNSPVFVKGYSLTLICMLICSFFGVCLIKYVIKKLALRDIYKEIKIPFNGKIQVLNALVDTGHNLFDYENKCPVILINREKADFDKGKVHIIEISTVNGKGSLLCLSPRNVEIEGKKYRATIGISNEKIMGYDALLSANMFIWEADYVSKA